jgi:hypothetical protein
MGITKNKMEYDATSQGLYALAGIWSVWYFFRQEFDPAGFFIFSG